MYCTTNYFQSRSTVDKPISRRHRIGMLIVISTRSGVADEKEEPEIGKSEKVQHRKRFNEQHE